MTIVDISHDKHIDLCYDLSKDKEDVNIIHIDLYSKSVIKNQYNDKWYSPEALQLFFPKYTQKDKLNILCDQGIFIKQRLRMTLTKLVIAHQMHDGWKLVINDLTVKESDVFTSKDIFKIQRQCKYLAYTLNQMLKLYDSCNLSDIYRKISEIIHVEEYFDEIHEEGFDLSVPIHEQKIEKLFNRFVSRSMFNTERHLLTIT
jgi:hypothetical protein